jgi:hypothetical protein
MSDDQASRQSSVRHLADLYAVIVGAALTSGIYNLFSYQNDGLHLPVEAFLLFLAFLFTIIPFYHGALRHLDDTFVFKRRDGLRKGALLLDFSLLFLHGVGFISLSRLITQPTHFFFIFIAILLIDAVWGLLSQIAYYSGASIPAEKFWGWINLVSVLIAAVLFVFLKPLGLANWQVAALIAIGAFARTLVDYWVAWDFYFEGGVTTAVIWMQVSK